MFIVCVYKYNVSAGRNCTVNLLFAGEVISMSHGTKLQHEFHHCFLGKTLACLTAERIICMRMTSSFSHDNAVVFKNVHFETHFQKYAFSVPKTPFSCKCFLAEALPLKHCI